MAVELRVSGGIRRAPLHLVLRMEGEAPPAEFMSNGCSYSPDRWLHWPLWVACHWHDYAYSEAAPLGHDARARRQADAELRRNLRRVVLYGGGSRWRAGRIGWLYWGRVRLWGASAFRGWAPGAEPTSWWRRAREVWG